MGERRAVGHGCATAGEGNALNVPAGYRRTEAGVSPADWAPAWSPIERALVALAPVESPDAARPVRTATFPSPANRNKQGGAVCHTELLAGVRGSPGRDGTEPRSRPRCSRRDPRYQGGRGQIL